MICPNCQKENKKGAKFCVGCGQGMVENRPPQGSNAGGKKKLWIGVAIIAVLAVLAYVFLRPSMPVNGPSTVVKNLLSSSDSPSTVVEKMMRSIESGDYGDYEKLITKDMASNDTTAAEFERAKNELKEMGGIKNMAVDSENITGDAAKVCLSVEFGNGDNSVDWCINLFKESGQWKIDASGQQQEARDAKRMSDMRQLISAQEMYYGANNRYVEFAGYPDAIGTYLVAPKDPLTGKGYGAIGNVGDNQKFCYYANLGDGSYYSASHGGNFNLGKEPKTLAECANAVANKSDEVTLSSPIRDDTDENNEVAGIYIDKNNSANYDELKADGTYESKLVLNGKDYGGSGSYSVADGKIIFTTYRNSKNETQSCDFSKGNYKCVYFGITHQYYKR